MRIKTFGSERSGKKDSGVVPWGRWTAAPPFQGVFYTVKNAPLAGVQAPGGGLPVGTGPWVGGPGLPSQSVFPGATSGPPCPTVSLSPPGCGLPREANLCTPEWGWELRSRQAESSGCTPVCSHAWGTSKLWVGGAKQVTLAVNNWTSVRA